MEFSFILQSFILVVLVVNKFVLVGLNIFFMVFKLSDKLLEELKFRVMLFRCRLLLSVIDSLGVF